MLLEDRQHRRWGNGTLRRLGLAMLNKRQLSLPLTRLRIVGRGRVATLHSLMPHALERAPLCTAALGDAWWWMLAGETLPPLQEPSSFKDRGHRLLDPGDPRPGLLRTGEVKQVSPLPARRQLFERALEPRIVAELLCQLLGHREFWGLR